MEISEEKRQELIELLTEIKKRLGPFSRDQLKYAENVIKHASQNAIKCLEILEGEKE